MRSNGPDVAAMAPLLAQAHANIKLLGELTGELGSTATGPQVAIQIVCPAGTAPGSVQVKHVPLATGEADEPVIDIMPDRE
jgi:hypothetical protein